MHKLALLPLLLVAGCAATPEQHARLAARQQSDEQRIDAKLAGLVPGKPTTCIPDFPTRNSTAIGRTILYQVSGRLYYRNDTGGGCEGMEHGDILITVSHTGQLCRGDIGRTVNPGGRFPTGSCSLGEFVPYTAAR